MSKVLDAQASLQESGRTSRNQRRRFSRNYEQVTIHFSILASNAVARDACTCTTLGAAKSYSKPMAGYLFLKAEELSFGHRF